MKRSDDAEEAGTHTAAAGIVGMLEGGRVTTRVAGVRRAGEATPTPTSVDTVYAAASLTKPVVAYMQYGGTRGPGIVIVVPLLFPPFAVLLLPTKIVRGSAFELPPL